MKRGAWRALALVAAGAVVGGGAAWFRPLSAQVSLIAPRTPRPTGADRPDYPVFTKLETLLSARPAVKIVGDDELKALVIARYEAAVRLVRSYRVPYESGRQSLARALTELPQLRDAYLALSHDPADHLPMLEFCLEVARFREDSEREALAALGAAAPGLERSTYDRLDAQIRLHLARAAAGHGKQP